MKKHSFYQTSFHFSLLTAVCAAALLVVSSASLAADEGQTVHDQAKKGQTDNNQVKTGSRPVAPDDKNLFKNKEYDCAVSVNQVLYVGIDFKIPLDKAFDYFSNSNEINGKIDGKIRISALPFYTTDGMPASVRISIGQYENQGAWNKELKKVTGTKVSIPAGTKKFEIELEGTGKLSSFVLSCELADKTKTE